MAEVTFEQGSNRAMADKGNGLSGIMRGKHCLDRVYDASLRLGRGFPSLIAGMRMGEEPVSGLFEQVRRKKTCRAAIILMHLFDAFNVEAVGTAKMLRGFDRFRLRAADDASKLMNPGPGKSVLRSFCSNIR